LTFVEKGNVSQAFKDTDIDLFLWGLEDEEDANLKVVMFDYLELQSLSGIRSLEYTTLLKER
jgi:hypothetical protein